MFSDTLFLYTEVLILVDTGDNAAFDSVIQCNLLPWDSDVV